MKKTQQTFYRKANISMAEAIEQLKAKVGVTDEDIISFTREGERFAAVVHLAEFPPKSDDSSGESDEPSDDSDDSDEPKMEVDTTEDKSDSSDSGSESSESDSDSDVPSDDAPKGEKEEKKGGMDEVLSLLHQILMKLDSGAPEDDLLGDDGLSGPDGLGDLPGVGVPDKGMGLPPVKAEPPLPQPVKNPKSLMPGGAFSHVVSNRQTFLAFRADAHEVNNTDAIKEALEEFPGYKVAKLSRRGLVSMNEEEFDIKDRDLLMLTMVKE